MLSNSFFYVSGICREYSLLNPAASSSALKGAAKKPQATDSVHPNKGDFITAKYQGLDSLSESSKFFTLTFLAFFCQYLGSA